jgi:3'-phosphoadenosine 5'-phosphosulfate sulfotransferase
LEALEYEALNEDLSTRRLRIDFQGSAVSRILVRERHSSVLANSERELVYLPGEGYRINANQQGQAGDNAVALQVTWLGY